MIIFLQFTFSIVCCIMVAERRAVTSGLPTQQRLSNHFELIRTKSTALTGLGLQDRLRTSPRNDTSGFVSEFVSNPTIRRLPQLRRSADTVSQLDEKPVVAIEVIKENPKIFRVYPSIS